MKIELTGVEQHRLQEILEHCRAVLAMRGNGEPLEYQLRLENGGVGWMTTVLVQSLGIERDITDFGVF